jgi:hypothetical protein
MAKRAPLPVREQEADLYASRGDFHTIFNEDLKQLYQLSFLLTRDYEWAERCLVRGLEDSVTGNRIFREWARSWAKRTIIQNAIRELKPRPNQSNFPPSGATFADIGQFSNGPSGPFELHAVLRLEDFERFVFVMSVLEHCSEHDCVLLLGCSVREFREARARAFEELMNASTGDVSQNQSFMQSTP